MTEHFVPENRPGDGWRDSAATPGRAGTEQGERCQSCGLHYGEVWAATNELWNEVNGSPTGMLCPACFDAKARDAGFSPYWTCVDGHFSLNTESSLTAALECVSETEAERDLHASHAAEQVKLTCSHDERARRAEDRVSKLEGALREYARHEEWGKIAREALSDTPPT